MSFVRRDLVCLALASVALGAAILVGGLGSSSTAATPPAPGGSFAGLVKIGDGRKMFLKCRGTGTPTVVLISGFRGGYDDWTNIVAGPDKTPRPSPRAVFPRIAESTRVCAYDRPGTIGFDGVMSPSTPVRQPTTADDGVADLHALLGAAGGQAPYVLVAHSWGGMIAQLYPRIYPQQVAGLVLVDPGSPYLKTTLKPAQWKRFARGARKLGKPKTLEAADYEGSVREIDAAPPAPKVPAVVLTADHPFLFGAGGKDTWPAWREAQNLLAAGLDAEHVTDPDSGHYIGGERPAQVVAAVRRVLARTALAVEGEDDPVVAGGVDVAEGDRRRGVEAALAERLLLEHPQPAQQKGERARSRDIRREATPRQERLLKAPESPYRATPAPRPRLALRLRCLADSPARRRAGAPPRQQTAPWIPLTTRA